MHTKENVAGSGNSLIFLEVKTWIVGPLSEDRTSGSGFFIGLKKGLGPIFGKGSALTYWADLLVQIRMYN